MEASKDDQFPMENRSADRVKELANELKMPDSIKNKSSFWIAMSILLLMVLSSIAIVWRSSFFMEKTNVRSQRIENIQFGPIATSLLRSTGSSYFPNLVEIKSPAQDPILKRYVRENELVQQGQKLLVFETRYLDLERKELLIELEDERQRRRQLREKQLIGTISSSDLDRSDFIIQTLRTQLEKIEQQIQDRIIRAPFDAIVTRVWVNEGESASGTVIELARRNELWIETNIRQEEISRVHVGNPVVVMFEAVPSMEFAARVVSISPLADYSMGTVTVHLSLVEPTTDLRSGYTSRLFFTQEPVLANRPVKMAPGLPIEAIYCRDPESNTLQNMKVFLRASSEKKQDLHSLDCQVWINRHGRARSKQVKLGQNSGEWIEILEGLRLGDTVIISDSITLRDGVHLSE